MGRERASSKKRSFAEILKDAQEHSFHGASFTGLKRSWQCAKSLFDYRKADEALRSMLQYSDNRLALAVFLLGGLVIFALAFLTSLESAYITNMASDTLSEITGVTQPKVDISIFPPIAAYQFLLYILVGTIINCLHEALAFGIARLSGGKGAMAAQLNLSSIVWLAVAMSLGVSLLVPLPYIQCLGLVAMVLLSMGYLMIYMNAKAFSIAHGISFRHALIIVLVLIIPRLAVWAFATNFLIGVVGLPPLINAGV